MDLFKEICTCASGCVATLGLIYIASKEVAKLHAKGKAKRLAKKMDKDMKKRIEQEKEYAYHLYLKQKAEIKKELK